MAYRIIVATLLVALIALGATGCQAAVERTVEETTGVRVDEDEQRIQVTGQDGEEFDMEVGGTSLPEEWPSDIPVYPGTVLENSSTMRVEDSVQMIVSWRTNDSVSAVYDWYRSELPAAGWEITGELMFEESGQTGANISALQGPTNVNINIGTESGDATMLIMTVYSQ